jgi:hypothetical protein
MGAGRSAGHGNAKGRPRSGRPLLVHERRAPWSWEITGHHNHVIHRSWSALRHALHNGWDHALKVTAEGTGLVGHAGAVLLRKAADQAGLTTQLSAALRKKGTSPLLDRGTVLVSLAAAIALGATSMSDIALLAHPARLARHARQRILAISPDWPWKQAFLTCWQRLCALPAPA